MSDIQKGTKMTKEELAALLNGRQYRSETTTEEAHKAKSAGLVIIYGASDDLMYVEGASADEIGAYGGAEVYFTRSGLLNNECKEQECPYFAKMLESATPVEAVWGRDGYSWTYTTVIPHATFEIMEDDEKYCRGIVFALADVPA